MDADEQIEFSQKNRTRKITINVTENDKALYDLLASEYDVSVNKEMWKVVAKKLADLRDKVIPKAA